MKKLTLLTLILCITLVIKDSNIVGNYFLYNRINIKGIGKNEYIIAIIDVSFDLNILKHPNIIKPFNAHTNNSNLTQEITLIDKRLKNNIHGSSIINIFIGKNGLLPKAKIIPIQIYSYHDLEDALDYAIKNKAQIINISLSFTSEDKPLPFIAKNALLKASKHTKIFIAAGNEGKALESTNYGNSMIKLANESNGKIFLVAATEFHIFGERKTNFTNYAITPYGKQVLLFAPGSKIKLDNYLHEIVMNNSISGTSIATPIMIAKYLINLEKRNSA